MNLTESKDVISSFLKRDEMTSLFKNDEMTSFLKRDELIFNLEQKQNISRAFATAITDIDALVDENKQLEMSGEKFSETLIAMSLVCILY